MLIHTRLILPLLFWLFVFTGSCGLTLIYNRGWGWSEQTFHLLLFHFAGATIGYIFSIFLVEKLSIQRSRKRLFFIIVLIAIITICSTAFLIALQYRLYFSQWHASAFSRIWFWQQFFTIGGALYTYSVMGLRLLSPIFLIGLLLTSWWVNRISD